MSGAGDATIGLSELAASGAAGGLSVAIEQWWYSPLLAGALQDGFHAGMQTFCYDLRNFVGTIRIDGTLAMQPAPSDWVMQDSRQYAGVDGLDVVNLQGDFLWLRVAVEPLSGALDSVRYKS